MNINDEFKELESVMVAAGKKASSYFHSDTTKKTTKDDGSLVTEIDAEIERMLRQHIAERFPDDTIVGEEEGLEAGASEFVWYIDPLDGTENFIRRIPLFTVTATRLGPTAEGSLSIIHNPASGQTYASLLEEGTYENEHVCDLHKESSLGRLTVNVGGYSKRAEWIASARSNLWCAVYKKFGRSGGLHAGLLQLAYVAAGRMDGYMSLCHSAWDTAAGLYLVKAAGGAISVFDDEGWRSYDGPIKDLYGDSGLETPIVFASRPDIHNDVLDFVGDPRAWSD